jgi:thiamine kinase-like enzyme
LETELTRHQRILSPSDFGFHNALRRADDQLIFLDFEYFGWDDPAKTIADILLHPNPAMDLPARLKERFAKELLICFGGSEELLERLRLVYPLFCIKWCIILLNEFLAVDYQRRTFANGEIQTRTEVLSSQLSKATQLYNKMQTCI